MKLLLFLIVGLWLVGSTVVCSPIGSKKAKLARAKLRIIDGERVKYGETPYHVSLVLYNQNHYVCGGAIISERHVLTAGHCLLFSKDELQVHYNALTRSSGGSFVGIANIYVHEEFPKADIALIETSKPMVLCQINANKIRLPTAGFDPGPGALVRVSGWGRTQADIVEKPENLLKANLRVVERSECTEIYKRIEAPSVTENMFCAGSSETDNSAVCRGDSGGPVVLDRQVIGIVSWSEEGCKLPFPGVFTRVGNYIDWIQSKMQNNSSKRASNRGRI